MPTTYHTVTINDAETASKFFSTTKGTLHAPAVSTLTTYDGIPCLLIPFGRADIPTAPGPCETPTVNFVGGGCATNGAGSVIHGSAPGDGGATAHADMVSYAASYAEGNVAYCFDIDPTKHGRYVHTSGAWVRSGNMFPLYEYDNNHMKVVNDLLLLVQTFFATGHPATVSDGAGPYVDKVAYPDVGDMTNHIIRLTLRAVNFAFPSDFKIGMHLQGEIDTQPRLGTGNGGLGAFPLVNAMNHADILGALGAGNAGVYGLNTVTYIADSGWVEIDIPMSPNDAHWTMMIGNADKNGSGGASYTGSIYYVGTTAKRLVGPDVTKLNAYLCGFRWNTSTPAVGSNTPRPRADEPTGNLYLSKVEFISPE